MTDIEKRPYWEYVVDPVTRNLPLPSEPRYERSTRLALLFLLTEEINQFPVDPYVFFKKYQIKLKTYVTVAKQKRLKDVAEVIQETGSRDGFSAYKNGKVAVCFNDEVPYPSRITFTLLHEIGHIVLGHLFDFDNVQYFRGGVDGVEVLEKEADNFARNVMIPAFLVSEMRNPSKTAGTQMFGCTASCWDTRISLLKADLDNSNPALIALLRQRFMPFMYGMTCLRCNAGFVGHRNLQYCPVCGGKRFRWKNEGIRYEEAWHLDESGRVNMCPHCFTHPLGVEKSCRICGTPLINCCVNPDCGTIALDGSARYCTHCGERTTFFESALLAPWNR